MALIVCTGCNQNCYLDTQDTRNQELFHDNGQTYEMMGEYCYAGGFNMDADEEDLQEAWNEDNDTSIYPDDSESE